MLNNSFLRKTYGRIFCTQFPSGLAVPWKLLSIQAYINYAQDTRLALYLPSEIEDEIFDSCVQDKVLVAERSHLQAGIVSTVANNIWKLSGPTSVDEFNDDLNQARNEILSSEESIIHDLVQIITLAFPYKPEEVYAMPYNVLLLRVAQAEKKLLQMGLMEEPVKLFNENEQEKPKRRPRVDAKKLYEMQRGIRSSSPQEGKDFSTVSREKWWEVSPILEAENAEKIDFNTEKKKIEEGVPLSFVNKAGKARTEKMPPRRISNNIDKEMDIQEMVERAQRIYAPVIKELDKRRQLAKEKK